MILLILVVLVCGFGWLFLYLNLHRSIPDEGCLESMDRFELVKEKPLPGYINQKTLNTKVVMFIHGFHDDGRACWNNESKKVYWPELVAQKFPGWNVFVYQYDNGLTIPQSVDDKLNLDKVFNAHKDVIIVAQSLGGLVARELMLNNDNYRKKTRRLLLLATPARGSWYADLASNRILPVLMLIPSSKSKTKSGTTWE